jgi:hypothetical protein
LVLVVPLRYQKTTPKPPPKTSSITGTRLLDLVGSGVASFIQRRTTDADHHPRPMTATPFFNPSLDQDLNPNQIKDLDLICQEVTSKFFNDHYTEVIMNTLKFSRSNNRHTTDFRRFNSVYHMIKRFSNYSDYVVFRKYLQTISAVYRWHFASFQHYSCRNSLQERINLETHCEHCGSLSKTLIDRLIEENLWAV